MRNIDVEIELPVVVEDCGEEFGTERWTAKCPTMPGCIVSGPSEGDAISELRTSIRLKLEWDYRVSDVKGATKERSPSSATGAKRTPERSAADEGSGTPPSTLVEQSEDAALPDGKGVQLTNENINTIASFIAGQPDRDGYHNRFDAAKKGLELYRDHLT